MRGAAVIGAAWMLLCGCSAVDRFYYYPNGKVYGSPAANGLAFEEVTFDSLDGSSLSGWFVPAAGTVHGTVAYFHGNSQNMTSEYGYVSWVPRSGLNLFLFDYRGYGSSSGRPTRRGIHWDSVAALEYVIGRADVDGKRLIVVGQSLGGAAAITAIGSSRISGIAGVVVESAFSCYEAVAKDHVGRVLSPLAALLVKDDYSPIDNIAEMGEIPLLVIHGTADRVVPYYHGRRLLERAVGEKDLWTIDGGRHVEAFTKYRGEIVPRLLRVFMDWLSRDGLEAWSPDVVDSA